LRWPLVAALLALLLTATPSGAALIDYIYVDGNEGQASGGHVGIAFGGQTFHFQFREDGWILPVRDASGVFERTYRVLENRNLRVHRVEVDETTWTKLRDGFNARYFTAEVALAELQRLRAQHARLVAEPGILVVPGAGFFFPDGEAMPRPSTTSALARLRRRLPGTGKPPHARAEGADARAAELAEAAWVRGAVLRPESYFLAGDAPTQLSPAARAGLRFLLPELERQVGDLGVSSRPDAGVARLLAMARYAVIVRSLETGSLQVLDAWPQDASSIEVAEIEVRGGRLDELVAVTRAEFEAAVASLEAGRLRDETGWVRLEDAANRYEEVQRAVRTGAPVRIVADRLVPELSARRPRTRVLAQPPVVRRAALARADREIAELRAELDAQSAYNLVTRNCVSEVFRAINELLEAPDASTGVPQAVARLGGHIAADEGLAFVPFVSADLVAERFRVVETLEWPSYRRQRLQQIYQQEGSGIGVYLREVNTITSTLYRHNAEDSLFLFFTDDVVAVRPLYGVVNLVAGVGAALAGIPLAPFDHGRLLWAGARGAFWSLPELGFLSVRKGSFFFVSDSDRFGTRIKAQ
jgi:hypothetical protein